MSDTRATVPATATGRRSPRRRLTLTLGAVAAALAVAVAVPLADGSHHAQAAADPVAVPAAHGNASTGLNIVTTDYAVKSLPDGVISVRLMGAKGIPGLQSALSKAGVPATVLGYSASCHTKVAYDNNADIEKIFPQSADGHVELIKLSAVPKGEHLLISPTIAPNGKVGGLSLGVVRQVPSCVPASDNGIG